MKNKIYILLTKIKRRISAWLFIHNIGSLPVEYDKLSSGMERVQFLYEHFGKYGVLAIQEREIKITND